MKLTSKCLPGVGNSQRRFYSALTVLVAIAITAQAQFFPGQGGSSSQRSRSTNTRQYPNNSTVGDAVISIDPDTRKLVVIADDETALQIADVVKNLDRPKPQVLIKVVFLEVQHTDGLDIGVEGSWTKNMGNSTTGAVTHAFGAGSIGPVPPGAGLYQIFSQEYQVTLRAIAQAGNARVLSRPSIIARNSQPATITVGQSVPLITNVRFDTFGNAINSVSYTDVGIILNVTPFITSDGMVEMIISPETSELVADRSQWVPISSSESGTAAAPLINSRSADTVVVTPDGQTVIIGGLMQDSKAKSESKIPFLGDIPVLGNLFKRQTRNDVKTELLIFLTPHIIRAPNEMADITEAERERSRAAQAITADELQRFLEGLPDASTNSAPTLPSRPAK